MSTASRKPRSSEPKRLDLSKYDEEAKGKVKLGDRLVSYTILKPKEEK